jgi:L-asparaginase/Glu-tRNA(Gln) amidotransferase subunit D
MTNPEAIHAQRASVEIIYAGGTISSLVSNDGYRVGGHSLNLVGLLEEKVPEFAPPENVDVNFARTVAWTGLSENMDPQALEKIEGAISRALDRRPHGVLLTHGTDSMEQNALALRSLFLPRLQAQNTRLILTGSNDDIEHPNTDAWDNLSFSLKNAGGLEEPDVYVAYHGRLIRADEVVKLPHIAGGESTFVSIHDPEYQTSLKLQEKQASELIADLQEVTRTVADNTGTIIYNVNVIRPDHDALLSELAEQPGVKNILLNLYHSGTAHTDKPEQSVAELVKKLRTEKGIVFFGVTENGEPVDLHAYETSIKLREAGVVPLYNMLRDVALAKLRRLDPTLTPSQRINAMLKNSVGEIDESTIFPEDIAALKTLYS